MYGAVKPQDSSSKQTLSNYGSLQQGTSSSSPSFSISSMDKQPSTSGCSSDMAYGVRNNHVKKQKVKQYIRTLMSMVGHPSGRKMSTLSTLQHVVDGVRKLTNPTIPSSQMCELKNGNLPSTELDHRFIKPSLDMTILLTMKKHVIYQVSPELMLLLDYPSDFWKGRVMTDFMHKRDLLVFNSNISVDPEVDEVTPTATEGTSEDKSTLTCTAEIQTTKTFYVRFRSFKTIGKGFNTKRTACYKPFQVQLNIVTSDQAGLDGVSKHRKLMLLKCLPLETPYKQSGELPEMRTFTMRHTMLCTVSHIHSNAIPLLGYLPQDIIGLSIFEIFHPEDLHILYRVFREVIESKGQSIQHSRMRLKGRNGDWVSVETEWSSFMEPWSKRLEFIMGQHTVISAPRDIDVFEENGCGNRVSSEQLIETQEYQNMIRKQHNKETVCQQQSGADQPDGPTEMRRDSGGGGGGHFPQNPTFIVPDEKALPTRVEGADVGRPTEAEDSMLYSQLNYSQNIKRYLMSQCVPGTAVQLAKAAASTPKIKTEAGEESSATVAAPTAPTIEPTDFPVPINFTKLPSYDSSTIVHVSEHREDTIPSPTAPPELTDDMIPPRVPLNTVFGPMVLPPQGELTQEALRKHTKLQERLLVQQAKHEDLMLETNKHNGGVKRSLSDSGLQVNEPERPKVSKMDHGNLEALAGPSDVFSPFGIPMVPISTSNMMSPSLGPPKPHPLFSQPGPGDFPPMGNIPMYMQQFPMMQVDPNTGLATPVMPLYPNTTQSQGIQWPYFQQTGVSFVPQVMGGFYQTLTGMFQPFPLPQVSLDMTTEHKGTTAPTTTVTTPAVRVTATSKHGGGHSSVAPVDSSMPMEMSRIDSSMGNDTDSSLMYILEASSSINNSSREDGMEKVKNIPPKRAKAMKRISIPTWLAGAKWTNDIKMRYQLPQRKLKNVLKADREALNGMDCGISLLTDQLRELLDNISHNNKVMDEEADYLIFEEDQENEDNAASETSSCCSDNVEQPMAASCKSSWQRKRRLTLTEQEGEKKKNDIEEVYRRWQQEQELDRDKDASSSDDDKQDLKKMGENDSNASNMSKDTSDITPSDQRSSEEAGSSFKESSCGSCNQKDSSGDSENETRTECALVESLFVKLPRKMRSSKNSKILAQPFWIQEAGQSELISKTYQMSPPNIEEILSADRRALAHLSQPSQVIEQLHQLNQYKDQAEDSRTHAEAGTSAVKQSCPKGMLIDPNFFGNLFLPMQCNPSEMQTTGAAVTATEHFSEEELMMLD